MKKCLLVCVLVMFLWAAATVSHAFVFSEILGDTEGMLVAYVDDKVPIDDPDDVKICFLQDAYKYQGLSVEKLFDEALKAVPKGPKELLLAAVFNVKMMSWMFIYTDWLDHHK